MTNITTRERLANNYWQTSSITVASKPRHSRRRVRLETIHGTRIELTTTNALLLADAIVDAIENPHQGEPS